MPERQNADGYRLTIRLKFALGSAAEAPPGQLPLAHALASTLPCVNPPLIEAFRCCVDRLIVVTARPPPAESPINAT